MRKWDSSIERDCEIEHFIYFYGIVFHLRSERMACYGVSMNGILVSSKVLDYSTAMYCRFLFCYSVV